MNQEEKKLFLELACKLSFEDLRDIARLAIKGMGEAPPKKRESQATGSPRGSRTVPSSWRPNEKHGARAREHGMGRDAYVAEVRKFQQWEFRVPRTDWDRAFFRWLDSAKQRDLETEDNAERPFYQEFKDEPKRDSAEFVDAEKIRAAIGAIGKMPV